MTMEGLLCGPPREPALYITALLALSLITLFRLSFTDDYWRKNTSMSFHVLPERRGLFQSTGLPRKVFYVCVCVHTYVYTHALNYNVTDGEICGGDKKDKLFNLILKPVLLWFIKMQIYIIKHEWNSFPNISFCFSEKFTFL